MATKIIIIQDQLSKRSLWFSPCLGGLVYDGMVYFISSCLLLFSFVASGRSAVADIIP